MKEGWEYKKYSWSDILTIINGKNQKNVQCEDGEYPIYGSGGIMGNANDYLCPENCTIIGRKGNINKPIYVETKFWNVDTAFGLLPNPDYLFPRYLFFFCLNYNFEKLNKAVTIPSLTKSDLLKIEIPLPPLSQQQSIVAELDKINEIIDLKKAQLKDLDLLAQSIFYDMFGDPIENSKGWETKTLGEISKFRRGSFPQPYGELKWYGGEDAMPFVQVADLQDESFDLVEITKKQISKEAQPMSVFVPTGTVLVSLQGSIGKVAITQYDCYVDRTVAIFNEIDESYYTQFFFAFELKYIFEEKRKKARGISIKTITKEEFTSFDCLLPPLSLQQSFAEKIQAIESQKSAIKQSLADVETLLASRMDYYFN